MEQHNRNQVSLDVITHIMHAYRLWAEATHTPYADALDEMTYVFHRMGVPFPNMTAQRAEKREYPENSFSKIKRTLVLWDGRLRFHYEKVRYYVSCFIYDILHS